MQIIFFDLKKTPPFFTLLKIKTYIRFSLEYPPPSGGGVSTKDGHFRQVNSREWRRKGFNFIELRFWVAYVIFYGNEPLFFFMFPYYLFGHGIEAAAGSHNLS